MCPRSLALLVDDVILYSNNITLLNHTKKVLSQQFELKFFGAVHYCLGLQVIRNRENKTIHLSQQKYIENILERFNMQNS